MAQASIDVSTRGLAGGCSEARFSCRSKRCCPHTATRSFSGIFSAKGIIPKCNEHDSLDFGGRRGHRAERHHDVKD